MKSASQRKPQREWANVVLFLVLFGAILLVLNSNGPIVSFLERFPIWRELEDRASAMMDHTIAKVMGNDSKTLLSMLTSESMEDKLKAIQIISQGTNYQVADQIVPALADIVMHEEEEVVRMEAARALNHLGATANEAKSAMFYALSDESAVIRTAAAQFLVNFGRETHKELVFQLISTDPKRFSVVAKSLSQCRPRQYRLLIPRLMTLSHHSDHSVRADAVSALGNIAEPSTLEVLNGSLHDPDGQVRAQAVLAVERVLKKPQQLVQAIQPLLEDNCPEVRQHVVQILGRIPENQPILTLITVHLSRESDVMTTEITRRVKDRLELAMVQQGCR